MNVWVWIGLWAVAAGVTLAVFVALVRGGQPLRRAVSSGLQGFGALLMVDVAGMFTGVSLGINWLTAGCCAVLGAPGVIALLVLKTIFRIG